MKGAGLAINVIKDSGTTGNFEIKVDGNLVYSAKKGDEKSDTKAALQAIQNALNGGSDEACGT